MVRKGDQKGSEIIFTDFTISLKVGMFKQILSSGVARKHPKSIF